MLQEAHAAGARDDLLHTGVRPNEASRSKPQGRVGNCSEGGPNLGFTIKSKRHGLACADGTGLPGTYSFITRTTHRASKLRAIGSLTWEKAGTC